ncbi:hypothetical protein COO60DRAFT_524976 [Scenedesmus sp. NREL 46B-D3]|nr:hypothetical protein COO60DRAFT_524976 [Scenedesmus sp. NREL 46B-D3]
MATLSCIVVLMLGNLLGAIVRGITGFGSAILNLCVWVVCTCLGVDAGTLQQAVVAECVCSEFCALPLLRLTRAASTCDWRLTTSLFIFGSLGAPVGAALLTALPVRGVEFVMACVLLLVIGAHCHVLQHARQWLHSRRQCAEQSKQCSCVRMACQEANPTAAALQDSTCTAKQQVAVSQVLSGHISQLSLLLLLLLPRMAATQLPGAAAADRSVEVARSQQYCNSRCSSASSTLCCISRCTAAHTTPPQRSPWPDPTKQQHHGGKRLHACADRQCRQHLWS